MASIAATSANADQRMSQEDIRLKCEAMTPYRTQDRTQTSVINGAISVARALTGGYNPGYAIESTARGMVNGHVADKRMAELRQASVERCVDREMRAERLQRR
jgi:hypothetical protein